LPSTPSTGGERRWVRVCLGRPSLHVRIAVSGCWLLPGQLESVEDSGCCPRGTLRPVLADQTRRSPLCLAFEDAFRLSLPGLHQAPLLGFSKTIPPSTWILDVHSGSFLPVARVNFASVYPCQGVDLVPPPRFFTAWTVFSVVDLAGLLHPAADPGIHRVPAFSGSSCDSPVLSFHDASPFEAFSSPAAFRSLRSLPSYRSPSKDGPISGSFSAGRVRRLSHVLPHVEARGSLGFLRVVFRLSSSWSPVPKDGVQGGSGSRCRTRRPTDFIETKSGWQTRSPHDPRESENSFSQVFCAWRLRPCAGLCGSWVTNPGVTKTRPPLTKRV
jgi:hypothetical protein